MRNVLSAICSLTLLACTSMTFADDSNNAKELKFGSNAPKLEVKKFLKGDPVTKLEKGKIYVVEFWATWCPPCVASIPHLTKLQEQYKDVTFVGVSVLEDDEDEINDFIEKMGDRLEYRVAMDAIPKDGTPDEGFMNQNWLNPSGLPGIPLAFIINAENKIAWFGRPMDLDEPLSRIVNGKWDLVAESKKFEEAKAKEKQMEEILAKLQKLYNKFNTDGDPDNMLAALDAAEKDLPDSAVQFRLLRFQVLSLSKDRADDAMKVANDILEGEKGEDPTMLNNLAWIIVTPDRESKADPKLLKLALKLALKADKLNKNEDFSAADTLAKAYFDNGDLEQAVKTQTRVVELAEGTRYAADPGLKRRLSQYKRALAKANAKTTDEK